MSYRKEEQFFMKEMEWGVNSQTNTTYMNHDGRVLTHCS